MVNLLIISWVLAVNLNDVHEGISARCAGLYGSFISDWKKQFDNSRIYWYSCKESCLYEINGNS